MTDNEKILRWLGYRKVDGSWVNLDLNIYVRVIELDRRDRLFRPARYESDPELDKIICDRVRKCLFSQRKTFLDNLLEMWRGRLNIEGAAFADSWLCCYLPGDYAEAARFLWESHASKIEDNQASSPRPAGATS